MFFFFSKILEFFIQPLSWILILAIIAFIAKKNALKRKLLVASGILLIIFSDPFLLSQFTNLWDIKPASIQKNDTYTCAIVLGGFSLEDRHGQGLFNGSADRFIQAVRLFKAGKVSKILVTGGNGGLIPDSFRESDWAKGQFEQFGIPDSCIISEDKSRNTIENAAFSKVKLDSAKLKGPYLLITSAFHMRRSLQIFKKTGLSVVSYPCNYMVTDGSVRAADFVPDAGALATWNIYIKEVIGYLVNLLR